jgi:hypothetical protein
MGKILSCVVMAGAIGLILLYFGLLSQQVAIPPLFRTMTILGSLAVCLHFLEAIVAAFFHHSTRSSWQVFSNTFWTGTIGLLEALNDDQLN